MTADGEFFEYEWWSYFLIPWIAGFVGYVTNVAALHMTFYPLEFWGIKIYRPKNQPWGIIGWQGIIPSKAEKMASMTFDLMTKELFNIKEIFRRLDPVRFAEVMSDSLLLVMDEVVNEVANKYVPSVWSKLPQEVKDDVVVTIDQQTQPFMTEFMRDMQDHVDDVVDIKDMTVTTCVKQKHLIVKIFQECGQTEFKFIRRSGFYFGFAFGIFQMVVWFFYPATWILPVAGFLVGWVTNYLALKCIFRPLEPRTLCGCYKVQGVFLKRQQEVSEIYARVVVAEVLHVKAMWEAIFAGPLSRNFYAMLRAHTLVFTEKLVAEIKPLAVAGMGAETFARMKEDIAQKVIDSLPNIIDQSYEYTQEAFDMERTLREKMQGLSSVQFEGVLHPAFAEDEIQLIMLGGVFGALVGVIQIFTLFG